MIVGVIILFAVAALCVVLGLLIWKKQKISLVHDYHHWNVSEQDVPAYCRKVGVSLIVMGAGNGTTAAGSAEPAPGLGSPFRGSFFVSNDHSFPAKRCSFPDLLTFGGCVL